MKKCDHKNAEYHAQGGSAIGGVTCLDCGHIGSPIFLEQECSRLAKDNAELKEALFFSDCEVKQADKDVRRLMKEHDELHWRIERAIARCAHEIVWAEGKNSEEINEDYDLAWLEAHMKLKELLEGKND